MATLTKTYTDNHYEASSYKKTWTITYKFSDITAKSDSFTFTTPTVTAKYVGTGGGTYRSTYINAEFYIKGRNIAQILYTSNPGWYCRWANPNEYGSGISGSSGTTFTMTKRTTDPDRGNNCYSSGTLSASFFFDSTNTTSRSVNVVMKIPAYDMMLETATSTGGKWSEYTNNSNLSYTVGTLTLDAPPTVTLGTPSSGTFYKNLSSYSVTITEAEAQYEGNITSAKLTLGAYSIAYTYSSNTIFNKTLSITPKQSGTFTPTVTVTDSRGQTTTIELPSITVNEYSAPTANYNVQRVNSIGVPNDEGTYGLITADITYFNEPANLAEPTVTVTDSDGTAVTTTATWYESWDATNGVSSPITWTNYNPNSPARIYGVVGTTSGFDKETTYIVTMSVSDSHGSNSGDITQTLSTAFYTIDIQHGGKEIAFGLPANDVLTNYPNGLFKCGMDMCLFIDETDPPDPTTKDGALFKAIKDLGWDSEVIA